MTASLITPVIPSSNGPAHRGRSVPGAVRCLPLAVIGGTAVTDEAMPAVALHHRGLRGTAARLVIATGKKKGQRLSPTTAMRMLREHDEKTVAGAVA